MTDDQIKARVRKFMEDNDLHDDNEHTCGYSQDLLGHSIESLCREMIAEGLERAASTATIVNSMRTSIMKDVTFPTREILRIRNNELEELVRWCQEEAVRVKGVNNSI